jgi:hypothetical protein
MSTPINVDTPINPNPTPTADPITLLANPTPTNATYELVASFTRLPINFKNIVTPFAIKYATITCKIDNLKLRITELEAHLTANTAPDFIIKQFKNILKNENELIMKQAMIRMKLNHLLTLKITQTNELIHQLTYRHTSFMTQAGTAVRTIALSDIPNDQEFWNAYLDYNISLKLEEFRRKQANDNEIKLKKQLLFTEKTANDSIPVAITQKELKTMNTKLKNLEIKLKTRPTSNPNKKQAAKRTNTSKSTTKNPKQDFHNGKQSKSQTASPKPRRTRRNN